MIETVARQGYPFRGGARMAETDIGPEDIVAKVGQYLKKPAYRVNELVDLSGFSRGAIYADVKAGKLRRSKRGAATVFLAPDVAVLLAAMREDK